MILACALFLSAFCGGDFASAEEFEAVDRFYYGTASEQAPIKADFTTGIDLILNHLRGFERISYRIQDGEIRYQAKPLEDEYHPLTLTSEELQQYGEGPLGLSIFGEAEGATRLLWEGSVENAGETAAATAEFFLLELDSQPGVSGTAAAGNIIEVRLGDDAMSKLDVSDDKRFALEGAAQLEPGTDVVLTVCDGRDFSLLQSLLYTVDESGALVEAQINGSENRNPVSVGSATLHTAQGGVYTFDSGATAYVSSGVLRIICDTGTEAEEALNWKLIVSPVSGAGGVVREIVGQEECAIGADEAMPYGDGLYRMVVIPEGAEGGYMLEVVRDITAPELYRPGDMTDVLGADEVVQEVGRLRIKHDDHEGKEALTVTVNGAEAGIIAEEGQKRYFAFEIAPKSDVLDIVVSDRLGNQNAYNLTVDRAPTAAIEEVYEIGEVIGGMTEAGASVELLSGDEILESTEADGNGYFEFAYETERSAALEVRFSDGFNEEVKKTIRIQERALNPIVCEQGGEIVINAADEAQVLTGTGEPNERIMYSLDGGEAKQLTAVNESGIWSCELPAELLGQESAAVQMKLHYYAEAEENALALNVIVDRMCAIAVDPCAEGMSAISGTSDPGAQIAVNGEPAGSADEDGRFSIALSAPLAPMSTVKVTAVDEYGNVAEETVTVRQAEGRKIVLQAAETGGKVSLSGQAEQGLTVEFYANEQKVGEAASGQSGSFAFDVPGNHIADGRNDFQARYQDARFASGASDVVSLEIDASRPGLELLTGMLTAQSTRLKVRVSEPCDVVVAIGDQQQSYPSAGGEFAAEFAQQQPGTVVEVLARGDSGYESERYSLVVQDLSTAIAQIELPKADSRHSFVAPLRVKGYVLGAANWDELTLMAGDATVGKIVLKAAAPTEDLFGFAAGSDVPGFLRFDGSVDVSKLPLGAASLKLAGPDGQEIRMDGIEIEIVKPENYLPQRIFALLALLVGFAAFAIAAVRVGKQIRREGSATAGDRNQKTLQRENDD